MPRQVEGEPYNRISVDEAVEFHGSDELAFIDVRRMDEYFEGHVSDAQFITVDEILARIEELEILAEGQIPLLTSFRVNLK